MTEAVVQTILQGIGALLLALAGGWAGTRLERRKTSGKVATSEAAELWRVSKEQLDAAVDARQRAEVREEQARLERINVDLRLREIQFALAHTAAERESVRQGVADIAYGLEDMAKRIQSHGPLVADSLNPTLHGLQARAEYILKVLEVEPTK